MKQAKQSILFICYGNINRSPTATDVCKRMAEQKNTAIDVASAGIANYSDNLLTKELADEADIIVVMEEYMKKLLEEYYGQKAEKILCLDIPDIYPRNDPELMELLKKELPQFLPFLR
jgi:predicted protein tyrosine phosphatase